MPEIVSSDGSATAVVGVAISEVDVTVTIVVVGKENVIVSDVAASESVTAALETPAIVYVLVELKGKIGADPELVEEVDEEVDEEVEVEVELEDVVVGVTVVLVATASATAVPETVTILVLFTATKMV